MALPKQAIPINFSRGLDQKTDPKQLQVGNFLSLQNTVFTKMGLLQKRNGYGSLPALPDATSTLATTFNGNLMAIGKKLQAYSAGAASWINKGAFQPIALDTLPLIRSNTNQAQADAAISLNGLVCTVYTDNQPAGTSYRYVIADAVTGQNIVAPTVITPTVGAVAGSPRVFVLGNYFMIVFTGLSGGTYRLEYIAVNSYLPTSPNAAATISAQYTPAAAVAFDGVVSNNNLYLAWNGSDGGGAIRMTYIDSFLTQHNTVTFAGRVATMMAVSADSSNNNVWATFYDSGSSTGYTLAVSQSLVTVLAPTQFVASGTLRNVTSAVQSMVNTILYEVSNAYTYDGAIATNLIKQRTCTQAGSLGTAAVLARSVGLASKAFLIGTASYFLSVYGSSTQPTYFLMNSAGQVIAKLAYSNGGGYLATGLPSVRVSGTDASIAYLIKDLVESVNKTQGAVVSAAIYSQTGINLVNFDLAPSNISTAEIGNTLNITGGMLWSYDGYSAVEQGFHVWPDSIEVTTATGSGGLIAQQYFYQVTYEWADNQGNINRSAPSIPVTITTTTGSSTNTINVPTLRLTYKIANPVKIVIYRWSAAQQTFYQVTSTATPTFNDPTVDSIAFVDSLADTAIIGNNIIYTNGGVIENIGSPAAADVALFKSRLFMLDAEDPNLLLFSKQVIEATPVEMSDLFSIYVAPTTGAQGSTGPSRCIAPMDDKLIIFKDNAISYMTGTGPDNTGANNDFSDPTFISSTVGCNNKRSIVFMPNGLMFQSDKGIWLLSRDLNTTYIGAPVESFTTGATVQSAVCVPGTNQVRFTLNSGVTLMYDYYYGQWGSFVNVPAVSSTLYQSLHTFINSRGEVYQETPNLYLDGSKPVLIQFTTSWINLAGLQGFQRAYFLYLLGEYLTPHKLQVQIAYDYAPQASQSTMIPPDNFNPQWGGGSGAGPYPLWGDDGVWGGPATLEDWRIILERGKCRSFQVSVQEIYDATQGIAAGAGLTLSGLNLVVSGKKSYFPTKASRTAG